MSEHLNNVRSLLIHSIRELRTTNGKYLKEIVYEDLIEALRELDLHKSEVESDQNECQSTVR